MGVFEINTILKFFHLPFGLFYSFPFSRRLFGSDRRIQVQSGPNNNQQRAAVVRFRRRRLHRPDKAHLQPVVEQIGGKADVGSFHYRRRGEEKEEGKGHGG